MDSTPLVTKATDAEDTDGRQGGGLDVTEKLSQMSVKDGQDNDVLVEATLEHLQVVKLASAESHNTTDKAKNDNEGSESNADAETAAVEKVEVVLGNDIDFDNDVTSKDGDNYYTDSSSDDEPFDWPVIGDENFTDSEDGSA